LSIAYQIPRATKGYGNEAGAEIKRRMMIPNWDEIGKLGGIVVLRTVLNYFLARGAYSAFFCCSCSISPLLRPSRKISRDHAGSGQNPGSVVASAACEGGL